jgi:RNA polymerase sigma-70 factor, ECF subfamily
VEAPSPNEVTALLLDWSAGDKDAPTRLMPLVYDELRRLARSYLRKERSDHTLQPTALVNEAFLRLIDQTCVNWENRAQFFGLAARIMRNILVDYARERSAKKRGGDGQNQTVRLSLNETRLKIDERAAELVALDEALRSLGMIDERKSQVVELRFFGGLSVEETAAALGISDKTVMRDWQIAKMWLHRELSGD